MAKGFGEITTFAEKIGQEEVFLGGIFFPQTFFVTALHHAATLSDQPTLGTLETLVHPIWAVDQDENVIRDELSDATLEIYRRVLVIFLVLLDVF